MLNAILLPVLALLGGAAGYLLRRWELATAFDEAGLATFANPATLLLITLSVVMVVLFALLCRNTPNKPTEHGAAFFTTGNWAYMLVMALAAACLLVAGLAGLRSDMQSPGGHSFLLLLFRLMCLVCFICVPISAWNNFRAGQRKFNLTLIAPAYMACLWLVTTYQLRAANSVVLDYVYELLAIICTLIALYYIAGFSFDKGKTWNCAAFGLIGIYFNVVTLADPHNRISQLLFAFAILYLLANITILLRHAFAKKTLTQEVTSDEQ